MCRYDKSVSLSCSNGGTGARPSRAAVVSQVVIMKRRFLPPAGCAVILAVALAACEAEKSSNPLSPSIAGPIAGVEITPPRMLEPAEGARYRESQQPIQLKIENASTNGVRPLYYTFEVAADEAFGTKMFARSGVQPGGNGQTSVVVDRLELGRTYYWRARAEDGANSGPFVAARFEVLPRAQLDAPPLVSPVNNQVTSTRRPTLVVGRANRNVAVGAVSYEFQIGLDAAFAPLVSAGIVAEQGGQTGFTPGELTGERQYAWRARASDGETTSPWSAVQTFRTPGAAPPPPGPTPPPSGGPCVSNSPEAIVQCERAKYGHMSSGEIVNFLRAVAKSLNANGIGGGPFGILVKDSGHNCHGYSCDIICAGNGGSQRQWDVLSDADGAQIPVWSGPLGTIAVRPCEIQ